MAQAVGCLSCTAEVRFRSQTDVRGTYLRLAKCGDGTVLSPCPAAFRRQYYVIMFHTCISSPVVYVMYNLSS
jgi:hypothetical protein